MWYNLEVKYKNKKMNKRLPIQFAVGIIIIIALIVGGAFWLVNNQSELVTLPIEEKGAVINKEVISSASKYCEENGGKSDIITSEV